MKIHAIITARGGSKGLPRKNILPLSGKPLIAYSILAARECKAISRCIVSTEDAEIKRISQEWRAEVVDRPEVLASDSALSQDVVSHVLHYLRDQNDYPECFVLLQPTSPLRTAQHLEICIQRFLQSKANSLVSVTEEEHNPYKDFFLDGEYLKPLFRVEYLDKPRQALPKVYRQNGAIYLVRSALFEKERSFAVAPVLPFVMDSMQSIDIDNKFDFSQAEAIVNSQASSR
jgi:CMP-N,N'-diacetyllegionaminic acid synthase